MIRITSSSIRLKPRRIDSHKGDNGTVAVIGGSKDYPGSPALVGTSALATLRSGADLVHVIAPEKVAWAINCIAPDLITHKIPCTNFSSKEIKRVLAIANRCDVITLGNGITLNPESKQFIRAIVSRAKKPLVLDAAALRVICIQDANNAIFLPHAGELETLLANSKLTMKTVQKKLGTNILVNKGHPRTEIIARTKRAQSSTGNAGMTHGGTGDVLCGIVAGLLAQGNDPFMTSCAAVYVNGKAADMLRNKMGYGYLASDLVLALPLVLKRFLKS